MQYVDGFFEWQKLNSVVQVNCLPARTSFIPFGNADEIKTAYSLDSSRCLSLNGSWRFNLFENYTKRSPAFSQPSFNCRNWGVIEVPSCWQTEGYGEEPFFMNGSFGFEENEYVTPPFAPIKHSPVGCYVKKFVLPAEWSGKRVTLCFEGVSGAFYVYINGERIGYSDDGSTLKEFDITENLYYDKPNRIAVEVYSYSTSSWLEGQPRFVMNGIFRDVYLRMTNSTYIWDYSVSASPVPDSKDGTLCVNAVVMGATEETELSMEVRKKNGKLVGIASGRPDENGNVALTSVIVDCRAWSTEEPYLYTVAFSLTNGVDSLEYAGCCVGFGRSEISRSVLLWNSKRIVLKGVCYEEFLPDKGNALTVADCENAVKLMKKATINAVKLSKPAHPYFYDLCDEYGIFVIDSCNLDTRILRGYSGDFVHSSSVNSIDWENACTDKIQGVFGRDKNHIGVLIWSMGNAGGENYDIMYNFLKDVDSRPICCENDELQALYSDIEFRSFVLPWDIEMHIRQGVAKPYILREFASAHGNSFGGNEEYKRLWNTLESFQGGFVSSFVDKFVKLGDSNFYAEGLSSRAMCENGLLFADMMPSPKFYELEKLYQNVDFEQVDAERGKIRLHNRFAFTDLCKFNLVWEQYKQGEVLRQGIERVHLEPNASGTLDLELNKITCDETYLNLRLITRRDSSLSTDGETVASEQFISNRLLPKRSFYQPEKSVILRNNNACIIIGNKEFEVKISKLDGGLYSYKYKGRQIICGKMKPSFWRASTLGDKLSHSDIRQSVWKNAAENHTASIRSVSVNDAHSEAYVSVDLTFYTQPESTAALVYTVNSRGIKVEFCFKPANGLPDIPQVGIDFDVSGNFERIKYFGNGPYENYSDRRSCAVLGVYENNIDELYVDYLTPQENGNRTDVRWAKLYSGRGRLRIDAYDLMQLNIGRYSVDELDEAERRNELMESFKTCVRVIANQSGVGGYDRNGALPLSKFRNTSDKEYKLSFSISPKVD